MERKEREPVSPKPAIEKPLGSAALLFIEPFGDVSYLDNPNTYLGTVDDEESYGEIAVQSDETAPSYAKTSEDFRLLRRAQRSGANRAKRAAKKRR